MSSNTTITFNANENMSMEQEIIPSHMQILTHHFESTNPLHIRRAKNVAFEQKPGQKESDYIQAFHTQTIDADLHVASAEEIFAQLCISRLHNQHVCRELLSRRQNPNFKQILEYAVDQEAAMQQFQASSGNSSTSISSTNVQTTTNSRGQGRGWGRRRGGINRNANPNPGNNTANNNAHNQQNKQNLPPTDGSYLGCWRCGDLKHYHQSFPFINTKCNNCNIVGHTEARCIKHKIARTNLTESTDM